MYFILCQRCLIKLVPGRLLLVSLSVKATQLQHVSIDSRCDNEALKNAGKWSIVSSAKSTIVALIYLLISMSFQLMSPMNYDPKMITWYDNSFRRVVIVHLFYMRMLWHLVTCCSHSYKMFLSQKSKRPTMHNPFQESLSQITRNKIKRPNIQSR